MATVCTPIRALRDFVNPNIVKVVLDKAGYALYFSRAPIPHPRDASARSRRTPAAGMREIPRGLPVYRHLGLYAYRCGFLRRFARLRPAVLERFEALEQLRVLAHGFRISVVVTRKAPHPGIDTPQDLEQVRRLLRRA
jgi:3-deoxy-manno-octulosonate cytidylyltransferase (CMP-KDO synthetase)